jgi:DNA-binding CsgD family transcriptional regulator
VRVLIWDQDTLNALDHAIEGALRGAPRVVVVHGGPGSGRTSLLATAVERAGAAASEQGSPFRVWSAGGAVRGQRPLQGLDDVGVRAPVDGTPTPLEVERALREAIDAELESGPLLIAIDDLQWLDPESVEALVHVLERAVAERLLLVATVGHLEPFQHLPWQRLVASSELVAPIEIGPLSLDDATRIARELRPEIREELARRLWDHTQGNPLFFTSLLRRSELADLERMEQLPAPDEYARAIEVRIATLSPEAVALARAAAVIGSGWMPLAQAAHVAGIADPTPALDVLDSEFILEQRTAKLGVEVRIVHAVIQASVYQHIPVAERVQLHAAAAAVAFDEQDELRHRYAAAATYDDELAAELDDAAARANDERSHRLAAIYLDWAARVTTDGRERSRRSMESFYAWILAGSVDFVRDRLPDIRRARDRRGAALVEGALAVFDNEWRDALRILRPFSATGDDDITAYRIEALLAWSSMCAGEPTEVVVDALDRAESAHRRDDALAGLVTFTIALMAGRDDRTFQAQDRMAHLPSRPAAVPLDDTYWLAWRGMGLGFQGRLADAIPSLSEVEARMATGFMDVGDGLTRAFLGFCHLLGGSPDLAAPHLREAEALLKPRANPLTTSILAGGHLHRGERERGAELIEAARTTLRDMPWIDGILALLGAETGFVHAFGTDADRAALLPRWRADFGDLVDVPTLGPIASMWVPLAYIWAGEPATAEQHADFLASRTDLAWTAGVADWIRGLAAEQRGDLDLAARLLSDAARSSDEAIAATAGHIWSDHARVARLRGEAAVAQEAERTAQAIYARAGAVPYLTGSPVAVTSAPAAESAPGAPPPAAAPVPGVFGMLSERERDVAALVVRGMSYAQIARELYITRSTVGFHLSRIYAKTGTGTRHELSELAAAG